MSLTTSEAGRRRRLRQLFRHESGRVVLVPVDDSLVAGPVAGLENLQLVLPMIAAGRPSAILGYKGMLCHYIDAIDSTPFIMQLSASTTRSQPSRKILVSRVAEAVRAGAIAAAVHVNIGSLYEPEMLQGLGSAADQCHALGLPLLAIMYPRTEHGDGVVEDYSELKQSRNDDYVDLVCHASRIGAELGADVIKTQYTGSTEGFERVVRSCSPTPVLVAGGAIQQASDALFMADAAVRAGAGGVSFGRKVFGSEDPTAMIEALRKVVQDRVAPSDVLSALLHPTPGAGPKGGHT